MGTFHDSTTFVDFETTGLDEFKEQITQYAVITYKEGKQTARETGLVKLYGNHHVNEYIQNLTGLSDKILAEHGKDEQEVYNRLKEIMNLDKDPLIVGFNVNFDAGFLQQLSLKYDGKPLHAGFLDPLTIAREELNTDDLKAGKRLTQVCAHYGITVSHAHDAFSDVTALDELTGAMIQEIDVSQYINKIGYLEKHGMFRTKLEGVTYFKQG